MVGVTFLLTLGFVFFFRPWRRILNGLSDPVDSTLLRSYTGGQERTYDCQGRGELKEKVPVTRNEKPTVSTTGLSEV